MDGDERCEYSPKTANIDDPVCAQCSLTMTLLFAVLVWKLLGINIFTYILAALIIFFLGANAALGPGWLGQSLGWEDVGTFTKVSDSLPLNMDVSRSDYLL